MNKIVSKPFFQTEVERIEDMHGDDSHAMRHGTPSAAMREKIMSAAMTPCPSCGGERTRTEEMLELNCGACGN